jgi:hypothetical protein
VFARRWSAWRRRFRNSRKTQAAVTVTIAVVAVVGALAGITLADQNVQSVNQAAATGCLSSGTPQAPGAAEVSASGAPEGVSASAAPCPAPSGGTATTSPTASVSSASTSQSAQSGPRVKVTADTYANGPTAQSQLGDIATEPVDGQGNPISFFQTPAQAAASGNCTLVVPPNPLTAKGLATPYVLGDGCSEANPNLQAFAEATILSPNGQVQVYNPLVITQGTTPAVRPVPPKIPRGAKVILDFGSNGTNLLLTGPGAVERSSGCVDAYGQSVIGQVSACDAVPFYDLANEEIARGTLRVPKTGTSLDGLACQDTRNFALIDQDPSDNTYTQYLLNGDGQTAQATPANIGAMGGATVLSNGSDNALLGYFVDPANGCQPFTEPDTTSANSAQSSQALDELSSRVNQQSQIAVVPPNDEMVLVGGSYSVAKTNVYRSLVDQPQLASNVNPVEVAAAFCMNMTNIAPEHDLLDVGRDTNFTSAVPAVGDNLATFMGNRLSMSFMNLGCQNFGLTDPVDVTVDGNDVATAVSYNTQFQQATIPASDLAPSRGTRQGPSQGHGHDHKIQNPSGM